MEQGHPDIFSVIAGIVVTYRLLYITEKIGILTSWSSRMFSGFKSLDKINTNELLLVKKKKKQTPKKGSNATEYTVYYMPFVSVCTNGSLLKKFTFSIPEFC